jgi:hypothetical protein
MEEGYCTSLWIVESPDNFLEITKEIRESPLVESPDNFLEITKEISESPLVESPGKLVR